MKLHFDANQDYQLQAIQAVLGLFEGQPLNKGDFEFSLSETDGLGLKFSGVRNNLVVSEEQILKNLREVQKAGGLPVSEKLEGLNFSVEMETGTGKTYVYLRTIYELNKRYGFKKFVIVVPSIAIKEGVLKNLEITAEHFQAIYDKTPVTYQVYAAERVSTLRNFADSNAIQILVINIDSFAKDENVINKPNDRLNGKKPVEFIQAVQPIVIVDEPQNMETDIRKKAISNLKPAFTLRYSATHKNLYNLIYKLDPVQAYDLGLVKQIEVDSVFAANDKNRAFIQIEDFKAAKKSLAVKLKIDANTSAAVERKSVTAKNGDDLYLLSSKREAYKDGYIINNIDAREGFIEFSNGDVLRKGQTHGGLSDQIMKYQMEKAVEEHFKKELSLSLKGIKVLSLFFIDRVDNYRHYTEHGGAQKGKFAEWFEEIYSKFSKKPMFSGVAKHPAAKVHNGYFAQDKKGVLKDSSEGRDTKADDEAYQLIMRDKERLLDINEPLKFIFSHSALREGWDNPNVFQICTLNETKSEMKKRQEIGRGLRLCVDQSGVRLRDKNVNRLTVIANESYEDFAKRLQTEIEEDCGVKFEGRIKDKRDRVKLQYRKGFDLDPKFLELWSKIKQKTTYRVDYKTSALIEAAARKIKNMPEVQKPVIKAIRAEIKIGAERVGAGIIGETVAVDSSSLPKIDIPDMAGYVQNKTELTRSTILDILKKSGRLPDIMVNPQMFLDLAVAEIRAVLHDLMIDGIKYEKLAGKEYTMMLFSDKDVETYAANLYKISKAEKTITDHIVIDSMSDVERKFAGDCEKNDNIEFFIKLPDWFTIKTPIGDYNPDWALIYKNENRIYFVAETKSTLDQAKLRPQEAMKIKCGKAHFKEFPDVKFKHVKDVSGLV
ncbi:MAG: DEAD/DEAH box helicase [Elusimicrobia bacterium CG08_land_8_20_14_0_20_51_18]|nr:MAG: DEAD/DEAH box helicase [Elusimicrobia bacterium CG08_land_8_20_14_0_20_51_18]